MDKFNVTKLVYKGKLSGIHVRTNITQKDLYELFGEGDEDQYRKHNNQNKNLDPFIKDII